MDIKQLTKSNNKLPQLSAPYTEVVSMMDDENIGYKKKLVDPNKLNPLQGIIYSDDIMDYDDENTEPIYVSNNLDVIDGHHRLGSAIAGNKNIKSIIIDLGTDDCIRFLTKIQNISDYKKNVESKTEPNLIQKIKEISLTQTGTKKTLTGYREKSINDNSVIGNFFYLRPKDGLSKYEIKFENLFDTDNIGLNFDGIHTPTEKLCRTWFPHIDLEKISSENNVDKVTLVNKLVTEHAKEMGFDGIKYSDVLLQALK